MRFELTLNILAITEALLPLGLKQVSKIHFHFVIVITFLLLLSTVLAVLWPLLARCTVVSKRSLQYLAPFGTAAWLWGTVFIDRGAQSARDALNKQSEAVKEHKVKN